MNRIVTILAATLLLTTTILANNITWQTTRSGNATGWCQLSESKLKVTLHPYYADVEEEATITTKGTLWRGDSTTIEIIGSFTLAQGSTIRSMLLWNGNQLLKAKLRTKADADSAYEDVVDRENEKIVPRDPALIEYRGNNTYSFKIYPVVLNQSRKIRILYTVPLQMVNSMVQYQITPAFIIGAAYTVNEVTLQLKNEKNLFQRYILQYGTDKKEAMFDATYHIPVSAFFQNQYYYSSVQTTPIIISPVNKTFTGAFSCNLENPDTKGQYNLIIANIPEELNERITLTAIPKTNILIEPYVSINGEKHIGKINQNGVTIYTKSNTPWDSTLYWNVYNTKSGELLLTHKQAIPLATDSLNNAMVPLVWASKYSLQENKGNLGALFGFIDNQMSLLALESDKLPDAIANLYRESGVPALTTEDILINTKVKPTNPSGDVIFDRNVAVINQLKKLGNLSISLSSDHKLIFQNANLTNELVEIVIFDAKGRIVQKISGINIGKFYSLSLPRNLKGMYVVQVKAGKEHFQQKCILR
jgi:hypothetical protein